ncbi:MAG: efflux RND transporter periplasmic adaptor subunit [Myxococcota bacterium]
MGSRSGSALWRRCTFGRAVAIVCAALVFGTGCGSSEPEAPPTPLVYVTDVAAEDVPLFADWVGSTEGYNNADIRSQVRGYLLSRNYEQGTVVSKGQLLFQIDPREFQAELDSALGQLGEARANLGKSRGHVKRYRPLAAEGAVSQQELDDAVQAALRDEAAVASARARVEQAKLNLAWTKIVSPIDGISGVSIAQIGDLVTPEVVLTTISQLDPIKVQFPISEQQYMMLVKFNKNASSGRIGEAGAVLQLFLTGDVSWAHRGTPFILGRQVDLLTGTILVEGRFPNPDNVLRPGQFARVRASIGVDKGALVIPQSAVKDVQGTFNVYVVKSDDTVEVRAVEVGATHGSDWIIKKGLTAGESIVVQGIQKIRSGMKVDPKKAPQEASVGKSKAESGPKKPSPDARAS